LVAFIFKVRFNLAAV
jgi:hypothetical protein